MRYLSGYKRTYNQWLCDGSKVRSSVPSAELLSALSRLVVIVTVVSRDVTDNPHKVSADCSCDSNKQNIISRFAVGNYEALMLLVSDVMA